MLNVYDILILISVISLFSFSVYRGFSKKESGCGGCSGCNIKK